MSAVLDDDIEQPRARRRIDNRDRNWANCVLETWGQWTEEHSDFEGYPRADAVANWLSGAGGGQGGHRVLCEDMPANVRMTHALVLMLPDHEQIAVWAHYVPACKEDGRVWTLDEKAQLLDITAESLRKRVSRARERIINWSHERHRN